MRKIKLLSAVSAISALIVLLGVSSTTLAADFRFGVEAGIKSSSVEHSFDRGDAMAFSTGVDCGKLNQIDNGIGNPIGIYGQWTHPQKYWGGRIAHYSGGDSTVQDIMLMHNQETANGKFVRIVGVGYSKLTIDLKQQVALSSRCIQGSPNIVLAAQDAEFGGIKFLFGLEKPLNEKMSWSLTATHANYSGEVTNPDANDGYQISIEPRILSVNLGLVARF